MIQISNLTKDYGVTRALDGVSFSVDSGEILGLLGPNGAGKTTTMRIVTGYLTPTAGTVRVQEMDVAENPLAVKRLIGYLPEFAPLYADMVVHDYLQYVGAVRRLDPNRRGARIRAMTELCGLGDVIHRPFRELSRGYKQRVGLAHAMLSDPDILILDEPTSGLDPNQIVEIRSIIKEAGREKTVIFSTHILSEAESTCDRIVIINRGRVVADGTAALVKARAVSGMVVRLALLDAPLDEVQRHLLAVPGVDRVQRVLNAPLPAAGALLVDVNCVRPNLRELYAAIKRRDWVVAGLNSEGHSLEDTFRELTGAAAHGPGGGHPPGSGAGGNGASGKAAGNPAPGRAAPGNPAAGEEAAS